MTDPTTTDPDQQIQDAIKAWIAEHNSEDVMVINYAVVAEVVSMGDSSQPWLKIASNDALSPWGRLGMAHALVQTSEEELRQGWEGDEDD